MTPERKKYLAGIGRNERAVRAHIASTRNMIAAHKAMIAEGNLWILRPDDNNKFHMINIKDSLAVVKKILSMLKKQLPQRWPEKKLKPCPFCGYKAVCTVHSFVYHKHCGEYVTYCPKCQCRTNLYISREPSVKAWNRRVE